MRLFQFSLFIFLFTFSSCLESQKKFSEADIHLIPKPQSLELKQGSFSIDKNTTIYHEPGFEGASNFFKSFFFNGAGISLKNASKENANFIIEKDSLLPKEGYSLTISEETITIKASDNSGAFYGIQTIRQLLPVVLEGSNTLQTSSFDVPQLYITDAPKFRYRGMHLDVGRHFFSKKFIKEYIANLALLKMNYFHWHLTEDQGWRIEILKYPKLAKHAAYRNETLIGHYNDSPQQFDGKPYGGFYTQEDIREIVAFAETQNIIIIPEIEMPGHAQAAISAYPELGCTGGQVPVATSWGVFENIYCPNEATFTFLENVLDEVIALFPGEYIHIGGDEAPKKQWEDCNYCKKLINDLNLKNVRGLQSYFIKRIEAYINNKGKKIIGWDEILEGGLAPNATVMSWRGTEGGIAAAKQKHDVIMTPTSHAYFDYYQSKNTDEPIAIGGFLPLKKAYSFNPVPAELNTDEAQYVMGAQGNIWTEYMKTEEKVEYMTYPRILAMSEVLWSGASEDIDTDYPNFLSRLEPFMDRLSALNINYANHLYEIEGSIIKKENTFFYQLKTPTTGKKIMYRINNSEPIQHEGLIPISENTSIIASVYKDGSKIGRSFNETIYFHKGLKASVSLNVEPNKAYSAGGKEALINGIRGSNSRFGDKEWLGFWGDDLEITIDFNQETQINMVTLRFYKATGQWVHPPEKVLMWIDLLDGRKVATSALADSDTIANISTFRLLIPESAKVVTQRIKLEIPNYGTIPTGLQGAGNSAWTFIDEISIE